MRRVHTRRSGYTIVLVVLFVVMFLGLWGLASRELGSLIRIEVARSQRVRRDAERLPYLTAYARALAALEVGYPPSRGYECRITQIDGSLVSIKFEPDEQVANQWWIVVAPTSDTTLPELDLNNFVALAP